ncbi:MAG: PmoA family protein [Planctomyces sp.]|nr:PmoA family protein [Planctomyces sp.]
MIAGIILYCAAGLVFTISSTDAPNETTHSEKLITIRHERTDDRIRLFSGDTEIAQYVFRDPQVSRPYFAHIKTLSGIQVSRNHPPDPALDATDHVGLHAGIWLSFGDISGHDFWRLKAKTEHVRFVEEPAESEGTVRFSVINRYLTSDGTAIVCEETQTCVIRPAEAGYRLEVRSEFRGLELPVVFGDQEEMGLGIRVATPIAVQSGKGGRILDSEQRRNGDQVWGKTANWCDYAGPFADRWVGMTVMSSPSNFRPSWSHARDYGFIAVNPFGRKAFTQGEPSAVRIQKGEVLRLRFAVQVHESLKEADYHPDAAYRDFADEGEGK